MAAKMSQKMERTLSYILSKVEDARTKTFEEWLNDFNYTLDDEAVFYLADVYAENKQGIVRGMYDGRTLNALEKRGYLRYFDDLEQERGNWIIYLTDEKQVEGQAEATIENEESETKEKVEDTTEANSTETDISKGQKSDDTIRYLINNPDRGKWDVYEEDKYDEACGRVSDSGYWGGERYAAIKEALRGIRIARFKTRKAAKEYIGSIGGIVGRVC
jgi:hypothetical protein